MNEKDKDLIGKFKVIESFLTSPDNQFGIIGDVLEGIVEVGAFAHIRIKKSIALSVRIDEVKEIQRSGDMEKHKLITFFNKGEDPNNFLYAMDVGNEIIEIRTSI